MAITHESRTSETTPKSTSETTPKSKSADELSPAESQDLQALFKEARRRETRRRLGIGTLVTLVIGAAVVVALSAGHTDHRPQRITTSTSSSAVPDPATEISSVTVTVTRNTITSRDTVADGDGQIVTTTLGDRPLQMNVARFNFGDSLPRSNTEAAYLKGLAAAETSSEVVTVGKVTTEYQPLGGPFVTVCTPACTRTTRGWVAYPISATKLPPTARYSPSLVLDGLMSIEARPLARIGTAVVTGVRTTEYRELVDAAKWSGATALKLSAIFYPRTPPATKEIDLWLDSQGRLRQVQVSSHGLEGPAGDVTIPTLNVSTWTFSNFNRTPRVTPPRRNDTLFETRPPESTCSGPSALSCPV